MDRSRLHYVYALTGVKSFPIYVHYIYIYIYRYLILCNTSYIRRMCTATERGGKITWQEPLSLSLSFSSPPPHSLSRSCIIYTTGKEQGWGLAYKKHSYSIIYYALGHAAGTQCSPPLHPTPTTVPPRHPRKSFTAFDYFSAPPALRVCICIHANTVYHFYTATTTTTTAITTALYHYRYVCVCVYVHMTTTNAYVYNICEGIVKKK